MQCIDVTKQRMKMAWTCFSGYEKDKGFISDEWQFWSHSKKLWHYISDKAVKGCPLVIVAHNIFFDLQVSDFFYYLTREGWVLDFVYDKGMVYILIIRKEGRIIKCLSSTNFFPFSLSKLGELLDFRKLDIDFANSSRRELIIYCRRDVEILRKAMQFYLKLLVKHDLGRFKLSRASQAFNSFRYRFMRKAVYLHKEAPVTELEQSGYFGGRVESRFLGKCPGNKFAHLDINSLYPYIMKKYAVPVKLIEAGVAGDLSRLYSLTDKYAVVAKVQLATKEPAYACRYKGKLIFPIGNFQTTVCTEGFKRGIEHGDIKSVDGFAVYDKANIFGEYVDFWSALRLKYKKAGNFIMDEVAKNFLNFLYGKFAQQRDIIEYENDITFDGYWREEIFDLVTRQTEVTTKMFNRQFRTYGREPTSTYFAAIAAHITEHARFYLYDLMMIAGVENIIYCDTDSLKMKEKYLKLYKNKMHPTRLGYLKLEDISKQLSIFGAKYYTTETVRKIKGVPSKAEYLGDHKYKYTQFFGQAKHLRSQVTRYSLTKSVVKTVKPFYDKGEVLADGRIIPIRL